MTDPVILTITRGWSSPEIEQIYRHLESICEKEWAELSIIAPRYERDPRALEDLKQRTAKRLEVIHRQMAAMVRDHLRPTALISKDSP